MNVNGKVIRKNAVTYWFPYLRKWGFVMHTIHDMLKRLRHGNSLKYRYKKFLRFQMMISTYSILFFRPIPTDQFTEAFIHETDAKWSFLFNSYRNDTTIEVCCLYFLIVSLVITGH